MNLATRLLRPLALLITGLLLAAGCSTTKQTESLLSAAGFRIMNASTPQQLERLTALPENTVTSVPKDGTNYFVFPVPDQKLLYVGLEPQYQEYQRLRLQKQLADEKLAAAQLNSMPTWDGWGAWGGPIYVAPTPYIRR